ncbi:MAG: peptidase [Clostridiaceae bacterium BRH_c20a]|nr:MAG: peptidase [Clostridiaceae bacterium BRH_c20a]
MYITYIVFGVVFLFVIALAVSSFRIVKQSFVIVVERLGKFHKLGQSGFHVVIPILDRVVATIDTRTQVIDSQPQSVITSDNVSMLIDTVVYYRITDPFKSTYEISDLIQAIRYLTTTTLRDVIGRLELDATLSSRDEINKQLRAVLDEATDKWGVRVERVEVKNIDPPKDVKDAMEQQMRAERQKRAAILEAQGLKEAAITTAQGEKESAILRADAQKEAAIREAEGKAQAIELVAKAESEKIKLIYDTLRDLNLNEQVLTYKSIEALEAMAKGNNKVFVPFESKGLLGSIGAIKELLKDDGAKV